MSRLGFTPADFRGYIRQSHEKHILVEGKDDKRIFFLLIDELEKRSNKHINREDIQIISAELLHGFDKDGGILGNREKVELICQSIRGKPYADKLVGFVDREFREFITTPSLEDNINDHKVLDRLVWSRGHSVENYYFEFETVRNPLRAFSVTDEFVAALDLFSSYFDQTIRTACAASLTGFELKKLPIVESSVSREILEFNHNSKGKLVINPDVWSEILTKKIKITASMAKQIVDSFYQWKNIVDKSDFSVVRWICHGHIGLVFIWAAYSRCVFEVCYRKENKSHREAEKEAQRVLMADESVRFNACAEHWVLHGLGSHCCYPAEVFKLLGLDVESLIS